MSLVARQRVTPLVASLSRLNAHAALRDNIDHVLALKPKFQYADDFPVTSATKKIRDNPVTSPLARITGIRAKGDVTGLSQTSRGSRRSGIWA